MAKAKADSLEMERRIRMIQEWIIEDAPTVDIINKIMDTWKVQRSQAHKDLKKARERWCETEDEALENKRKLRVLSLKKLKRTLNTKYKDTPNGILAVLAVEKEINKIEGVYPASQVELTGKDGQPIQTQGNNLSHLSFEELYKLKYGDSPKT